MTRPKGSKCNRLEADGVVETPASAFHTFPAIPNISKYASNNRQWSFTIPIEIIRKMGCQEGNTLQIAVRKITREQAIELFGYIAKNKRRKRPLDGDKLRKNSLRRHQLEVSE